MQPWKKKKSLMRPARITAVFEAIEREVLGNLTAAVSEAIIRRAQSAPRDELAEMMGMPSGHKEAPEDPALRRLFPDFLSDADEEFEGDAQLMRSLHESDIARAKLENLQLVNEVLGPTGGVEVTITEEQAHQFVAGINDIRLFLASSADPRSVDPLINDPDTLVDWLGFVQDSLLEALMD